MQYVYYALGLAVTLFTIIDLIWTTLWVDGGAGPLSDKLTTLTWKMIKRVDSKFLYNITGPLILSLILVSWFLLMWIGVTLFFAGDPESIIDQGTNGIITWYERFYFSGYALFTMGLGDYSPRPGFFQVVTALVSGMGMLLLTFGASYIISIVSAVVEKRSFARSVSGLGLTSIELVEKAWNGKDFYQLELILNHMNAQITKLSQQNQAFPLLQYYHSENARKSSVLAVSILDEALTLLRYGLNDQTKVNTTLVKSTQSSIETYLETIIEGYGNQAEEITEIPSVLNLAALEKTTIPLATQEKFDLEVANLSERRNQLLTIVELDNHDWPNE